MLTPWTPVKATLQDGCLQTELWGRSYRFDRSPLPSSILSGSREILSAPISLNAFFHGQKGDWHSQRCWIDEQDEEHLVFSAAQETENLILNARVRVEFDGLIWADLALIPFWSFSPGDGRIPRLDGLTLEIPLKAEIASLYHFWPGGDTGLIPEKTVKNSDFLPKEGMELPFKPLLWLGREEAGLGWFCESEQNLQPSDPSRMIEILPQGETVLVKINLLETMPVSWQNREDQWTRALPPIHLSFGLQATPVKPYAKHFAFDRTVQFGYHQLLSSHDGNLESSLDRVARSGARQLILHEDWSRIQNYGLAEDEEALRKLVHACHLRGIRVLVYFGYEFSTLAPNWFEKWDSYLLKSSDNTPVGGWQRKPSQRDYIVCYRSGYSQEMIDRALWAMEQYGVDGIYTDGTFIPWECANTLHGCGYTDREGRLRHTFPILALRDHVKRLYTAIHERGGYLDTHQSSCCMTPTLAFCDSYLDGEHIQAQFQENLSGYFSMGTVRSEFSGYNYGIPSHFLIYSREGASYRSCCGVMLLNGVLSRPWSRWEDLDQASEIWKIMGDFQAEKARFIPFWQDCPVKVLESLEESQGIKASVWSHGDEGRLLTVLFSAYREEKTVQLRFSREYTHAVLHTGTETRPLVLQDGQCSLTVPPLDPQFIEIW